MIDSLSLNAKYDYLVELFGEEYVSGGLAVGGFNDDTLDSLCYYKTAMTIEQYMEMEEDKEYN